MGVLWIIVQIIALSFGFVCFLALSKWRYNKYIVATVAAVFIAGMSVINFIAVRDLSYLLYMHPCLDLVYRVCNIILAVLIAFILTKQPAHQKVYTLLTVIVCVLIVDTIAITLRILVGHAIELLLELLLYSLMTYLLIIMRNPFLQIVEYLDKRLRLLSAVPVVLIVCFFLQISFPKPLGQAPDNLPVALTLSLVAAAVYGVKFFLFITLRARMELEQNVALMRLNISALEHQNELIAQNAKKAALFRHDLRHITQMMSLCADNGDLAELKKLIKRLDKNVGEESMRLAFSPITGHKPLDIMLGYFIEIMHEAEINFDLCLCPIENTRADLDELTVVIANALENAVHACETMEKGQKREVRLNGKKRGKQYFLEIANTIGSDAMFDRDTGLPVRAGGGGLGSQSIAYFAQKHGAVLEYNQSNGWFHLRMLI